MASENLAPRDAKVISVILRSLGIEECEPQVIIQLLEFVYRYSCDIIEDAKFYANHREKTTITTRDLKLALQTNIGKYFLPTPPRSFLKANADIVNRKPLSLPDPDNYIRVPMLSNGFFNAEYSILRKETQSPKKKKL